MLALTARSLITPFNEITDALVLIEESTITFVGSRRDREIPKDHLDFGDSVLAPGYIDLHVHGGAGFDVMHASASELAAFECFIAKHGVTSYLPTTVTSSVEEISRSLERLGAAVKATRVEAGRARPLGIHLEGPFISHRKRGVHPPQCLQPADVALFDRFFDAASGGIKMMTFAPELPNGAAFIRHAVSRGVCVSLGHSDANFAQAQAAIDAGARSATHTFNAMRPLDHRDPGILGAALTSEALMADMIADGIHLHPDIVRLFLDAKGDERAILITDAISATGMPDGTYQLGGLEVQVKGDRCEHEGTLAGSVLTLDRAVRNVMRFAPRPLQRCVRLATANPARLIGLKKKGEIKEGADADMVVLTGSGEVKATVVGGKLADA